jgi:hypothetical protein
MQGFRGFLGCLATFRNGLVQTPCKRTSRPRTAVSDTQRQLLALAADQAEDTGTASRRRRSRGRALSSCASDCVYERPFIRTLPASDDGGAFVAVVTHIRDVGTEGPAHRFRPALTPGGSSNRGPSVGATCLVVMILSGEATECGDGCRPSLPARPVGGVRSQLGMCWPRLERLARTEPWSCRRIRGAVTHGV